MTIEYNGREYLLTEMKEFDGATYATIAIFRLDVINLSTNEVIDHILTQEEEDDLVDRGEYQLAFTFINYFWYGGRTPKSETGRNIALAKQYIDEYIEAHSN